ncbi:MAG TPA: hypothetical protein VIV55_03305 [Flavobacterium sp.]
MIIIALFSLNSCSSNEPLEGFVEDTDLANPVSNPSTSTVLLKKTITTYPDGAKTVTNFNYDGIKLISITDDSGDGNVYFIYTGDLITKIEYKLPDGTLEQVDSFTYNSNGKLASFVREITTVSEGTFIDSKEVYTYNTDGSISVKEESGSSSTGTIKFVDGEVSEITSTNSATHKYVYDAKNSPFKNVLGWDKISFYGGEADGILHNIISDTSTQSYDYTYTYNSDNYPTKSVEIDNTGFMVKTEYFY